MTSPCCEAYVSAPIKLAAEISEHGERRRRCASNLKSMSHCNVIGQSTSCATAAAAAAAAASQTKKQMAAKRQDYQRTLGSGNRRRTARALQLRAPAALAILTALLHQTSALLQHAHNSQLVNSQDQTAGAQSALSSEQQQLRHQAHYMNFVPSSHFSYNEGRQMGARSLDSSSSDDSMAASSSHIYKRSSAVLMPPAAQIQQVAAASSARAALDPLSRRMMSAGERLHQTSTPARQSNWLGVAHSGTTGEQEVAPSELPAAVETDQQTGFVSEREQQDSMQQRQRLAPRSGSQVSLASNQRKQVEREAELLRQKQHIQYHDQWPSMAGKCHKRTLNFCASVLPFNTTTFPNIIGDTNRFEVKRSLPFFGFLAKSSCNKRLDELLCLLLEPPCQPVSGAPIPPCKKFCRLALEGCNEYIPATLALSSVFDCRQYPDSTDPNVCVNLAQGNKCAADEFKCPDKTCIPRNWLCDGVRDCVFAADEANCTDSAASPQASVCSTEEFKCDGKCVPKAWKCDGERDCLDGSDEESCDARPRCGPDRFKCHDGNGCIPKRWVCDGKAECRDGSDEMNCEQRECSENDFKCDNGICIPKLWRCDRQFDCKDGSDERQCVYPTPSATSTTTTSTTTTTTTTTTTASPDVDLTTTEGEMSTTTTNGGELFLNASSSYSINHQQVDSEHQPPVSSTSGETGEPAAGAKQQLEMSLNGDISRIIQHERESLAGSSMAPSSPSPPSTATSATSGAGGAGGEDQPSLMQTTYMAGSQEESTSMGQQVAKELKKYDYDLLPSSSNELPVNQQPQMQKTMTQIDFVQQQQQQQQQQQGAPVMDNNIQQQPQVRGVKFGGSQQVQMMQEGPVDHPQQQQQQPPPPSHRVPIYRSLFKSFKGHHQGADQHHRALYRQQVDRNGTHRNVVAIARRRRDRHHHPNVQQQQQQQQQQMMMANPHVPQMEQKQDSAAVGQLIDIVPPVQQMLMHNPHQQQQMLSGEHQMLRAPIVVSPQQQQQQQQQQHYQPSPVANYLHMLNSRYNLRLPRVVSGAAAAAASSS